MSLDTVKLKKLLIRALPYILIGLYQSGRSLAHGRGRECF